MHRNLLRGLVVLIIAGWACAAPVPTASPATRTAFVETATAIAPTTETVTVEATAPPLSFAISILVDLDSQSVPAEGLAIALEEASTLLLERTGFVFTLLEVVEGRPTDSIGPWVSDYLAGKAPPIPNGVVVFSYGEHDFARSRGGYSFNIPAPAGFVNAFVSPVAGGRSVYVAVLHWGHRFGACGYDESGNLVSEVAIDGQCRNQPGTTCTTHNGYSMCSNVVDDPYASTPTYFVAANFVHEFLHPFGLYLNYDHYGTAECREVMGWGSEWVFSDAEASYWLNMCPYVYDNFRASYRP